MTNVHYVVALASAASFASLLVTTTGFGQTSSFERAAFVAVPGVTVNPFVSDPSPIKNPAFDVVIHLSAGQPLDNQGLYENQTCQLLALIFKNGGLDDPSSYTFNWTNGATSHLSYYNTPNIGDYDLVQDMIGVTATDTRDNSQDATVSWHYIVGSARTEGGWWTCYN